MHYLAYNVRFLPYKHKYHVNYNGAKLAFNEYYYVDCTKLLLRVTLSLIPPDKDLHCISPIYCTYVMCVVGIVGSNNVFTS